MIRKNPSGLLSADDLFNNALPTFTKQIRNNLKDGWGEFRADLDLEMKEKWALAQAKALRMGAAAVDIDRVVLRYPLYRKHGEKIGEDFLLAFTNILKPHCRDISEKCKAILFVALSDLYKGIVEREIMNLKQLAASMGRINQSQSMILPMQSIYYSALSKYQNRLEVEIGKHNLEVKAGEIKRKEENHPIAEIKTLVHTPKHVLIKSGVNKMLESLRLEKPETSLEEAKRIYAHLNGLSYTNVNKSYHYTAKK
ncbi:MAG: hypothetical protein ABSF91_03055 [Bacteroidota bacterium]|jgi:hypothetical protein